MAVPKGLKAAQATGEDRYEAAGLSPADLRKMYEIMLLSRLFDERSWLLNRQGKVHFLVSCQGQEACQVGSAWALRPGVDYVFPYYRDTAVVLTLGMTPREIALALFGKAEDPNSGGRQMPNHFGCRRLKILSGSSPVGTQIPQAAGVALAARMRGEDAVTWVSFGEGVSSKGDFHEGINFAAVHRLPVIFFCENNEYAISVPQSKQMAVPHVADRAPGYGIPGVVVDGTDPIACFAATREAVARARRGEGPTLIEAKCYRLLPHSSADDDRTYRSQTEVEEQRRRDPVPAFGRYLKAEGLLTDPEEEDLRRRLLEVVDEGLDDAERAPFPRPEDLYTRVYGDR